MATIIYEQTRSEAMGAAEAQGDLWVGLDQLEPVSGWALKPEGLCRRDECVPVAGRQGATDGDRVNLSEVARLLGQPILHEPEVDTWLVGPRASAGLASIEAPDFTLPDLAGKAHTLSDYRGRKVFLVSWASW